MVKRYSAILNSIKDCPLSDVRCFINEFDQCSNATFSSRPDMDQRIHLDYLNKKCDPEKPVSKSDEEKPPEKPSAKSNTTDGDQRSSDHADSSDEDMPSQKHSAQASTDESRPWPWDEWFDMMDEKVFEDFENLDREHGQQDDSSEIPFFEVKDTKKQDRRLVDLLVDEDEIDEPFRTSPAPASKGTPTAAATDVPTQQSPEPASQDDADDVPSKSSPDEEPVSKEAAGDAETDVPSQQSTEPASSDDASNKKSASKAKKPRRPYTLGHPAACYPRYESETDEAVSFTCDSSKLYLRYLGTHFSKKMVDLINDIDQLEHLLYMVHKYESMITSMKYLEDYNDVKEMMDNKDKKESHNMVFTDGPVANTNEREVQEMYREARKNMIAYMNSHLPVLTCISCLQVVSKSSSVNLDRLRVPIRSRPFREFTEYMEKEFDNKLTHGIMCNYCKTNFDKGKIPPLCRMNNLEVTPLPKEIQVLNDTERHLTQRAKACQVLVKMGTVSGKKLPHYMRITQAHGQVFYLPLTTEATINKLPTDEEVFADSEVFVMVRRQPTNAKNIYEEQVSVQKLHDALRTYKEINPFYEKIQLPENPDDLHYPKCNVVQVDSDKDDSSDEEEDGEKDESPCTSEPEDTTETLPDNPPQPTTENADSDDPCEPEDTTETLLDNPPQPTKTASVDDEHNADSEDESEEPYLTQMAGADDPYYDNYTIYPLHGERQKGLATEIYQMKRTEKSISSFEKELEYKCFPHLYPEGKNGLHETRPAKVGQAEFFKSRVRHSDPRFRRDIPYMFHCQQLTNYNQINQGIYHKLKITNKVGKTAQDYINYVENEQDEDVQKNLSTVFGHLRNSEEYWKRTRGNLDTMIKELGPPTWFVTMSPSEYTWPELQEYLYTMNPDWKEKGKSLNQMIAEDAVSVSRFINTRFFALLKFITSPNGPLGKITRYFWRREYQSRGIQHFHLLFWADGAPVIGKDSSKVIGNFITEFVSCRLPDGKVSPNLRKYVTQFNRHSHNSYCLRQKKGRKVCRFGFPRKISEQFQMRDLVEAIASRQSLQQDSRLYHLPRRKEEQNINDYCPAIMMELGGNNDVSYVADESGTLGYYVTKYQTKPEKGNTNALELVNSNKSLRGKIWNFSMKVLNKRECGLMETADTLLGHSLFGFDPDTNFRWIDTNLQRNRITKPYDVAQQMAAEKRDVESILKPGWVDTFYANRPKELENLSLYQFSQYYDKMKHSDAPKSSEREIHDFSDYGGVLVRRIRPPYIIRHYNFDVEQKPNEYFHALLLLHQPWRDPTSLLNNHSSYKEAFDEYNAQNPDNAALKDHEKEQLHRRRFKKISEEVDKKREELNLVDPADGDNAGIFEGNHDEAEAAMQEVADSKVQESYYDLVETLNPGQKAVLTKMIKAVESGERYINFCSGMGGCGKSYLAKTMRAYIEQVRNRDVAVGAPTGIAAKNIGGITLHRLFQLPVQDSADPKNKIAKYEALGDEVLQLLRNQLRNTDLFIIDEISMVGNISLLYIHKRLQEIFQTENDENGWFGGKSIIFFGDLCQLPPVSEQAPYKAIALDKLRKYTGGGLASINLWESLVTFDELTQNERQAGDVAYGQLLARLRYDNHTAADEELLKSRLIKFSDESESSPEKRLEELSQFVLNSKAGICLLAKRFHAKQLNEKILDLVSNTKVHFRAEDGFNFKRRTSEAVQQKAADAMGKLLDDTSRTAGFETDLNVKIGCRVMVVRNDAALNLSNGDIGVIKAIKRKVPFEDSRIEIELTRAEENGRRVVIMPIKVSFPVMSKVYVERRQFPLVLAYAMTIHKSQSLSVDEAIIDIENSVFSCAQSYVALSRIRTLAGLHLINVDPSAIKVNKQAIREYDRLRKLNDPKYLAPRRRAVRRKKVSDVPFVNEPNRLAQDAERSEPLPKKPTRSRRQPAKKRRAPPATANLPAPPKKARRTEPTVSAANRKRRGQPATASTAPKRIRPTRQHPLSQANDDLMYVPMVPAQPISFVPVTRQWQEVICASEELPLHWYETPPFGDVAHGIPSDMPPRRWYQVIGDGNCLFRSMSYLITGRETQFRKMRRLIVNHIRDDGFMNVFLQNQFGTTSEQYLRASKMRENGTRGTHIEIYALSHLIKTDIVTYSHENRRWATTTPSIVQNDAESLYDVKMYLENQVNHANRPVHFNPVLSIL